MMKNIFKIITSVIGSLIFIFIILAIGINYFAGLTGKVRNGESFCINKEYSIGKMLGGDNLTFFCDNKEKNRCINGLKSYTLGNNKDLYLSFDLPAFVGKTEKEINNMLDVDNPKGWIYYIFQNNYNNKYYAKNYDEIIRFLKLNYNDCSINFYSNSDVEKLSDDEKNIFKGL